MLDHEHKASFNSSSILTNVQVSNQDMAEIGLISDSFEYRNGDQHSSSSYFVDVNSGLYDKRSVQFKNLTGRVYITADSSHYIDELTKGGLQKGEKDEGSLWGGFSGGSSKKVKARDVMRGAYQSSINGMAYGLTTDVLTSSMAVEVVRNVDVEPKYKSLYIGTQPQTYKLRILHGSGTFSVTVNNTKLVDLVHKDRDIFLTPRDIGGLKIMVEDLELP